jgi:hypothetical protein
MNEYYGLPACKALYFGRFVSTFRIKLIFPSIGRFLLKMKTVFSSRTSVTTEVHGVIPENRLISLLNG